MVYGKDIKIRWQDEGLLETFSFCDIILTTIWNVPVHKGYLCTGFFYVRTGHDEKASGAATLSDFDGSFERPSLLRWNNGHESQ